MTTVRRSGAASSTGAPPRERCVAQEAARSVGALITDSVAVGGDPSGWLRSTSDSAGDALRDYSRLAKPRSLSKINDRAERVGTTRAFTCARRFSERVAASAAPGAPPWCRAAALSPIRLQRGASVPSRRPRCRRAPPSRRRLRHPERPGARRTPRCGKAPCVAWRPRRRSLPRRAWSDPTPRCPEPATRSTRTAVASMLLLCALWGFQQVAIKLAAARHLAGHAGRGLARRSRSSLLLAWSRCATSRSSAATARSARRSRRGAVRRRVRDDLRGASRTRPRRAWSSSSTSRPA